MFNNFSTYIVTFTKSCGNVW